jgi:tRNA nucleotidyltransferase (CCA-adding enzyme)
VDPFGGRADLLAGRIRMLHPRSAFDDPTRALRAVRYAARLGFRVEAETRRWIAGAIRARAFDAVSGDRLRREIALVLGENSRGRSVGLMRRLGLDAGVSPALAVPGAPGRIRRAERIVGGPGRAVGWLFYLLVWMAEAAPREIRRVCGRLGMTGEDGRRLRSWPRVRRSLGPGIGGRRPSEIGRRVRGLSRDEILAASTRLARADRKALLRWVDSGARVGLGIRGADLVASGVPPGPAIGRALERTLAARQDGRIPAAEELAFALAQARGVLP